MTPDRDSLPDVTPEMIAAVHRHECLWKGHSWDVIHPRAAGGPTAVICSHCGKDSGLVQAARNAHLVSDPPDKLP